MNQNIIDLLKKIRVQAQTIKGGFSEVRIRDTALEDKWVSLSMKNPDHQCMFRKLVDTKTRIVIGLHAPAGSSFYSHICTDADATYQVASGRLYDAMSGNFIDMQSPHTFPVNILHEIEVRDESIFTITYTNFR